MARNYKTGLIITGDASGGIRAIRSTDEELGKLNKGFDRGSRRTKQFTQNVNGTSRELQVLRRVAAPVAAAVASMFAANSMRNQINFADQLQKTNLRIGASTEALSEYNYVAKLAGVEFGQLTTAWQRQSRRIAQAAQGTGEAQDALKTLNLTAAELAQLAPEDQFERIAQAMNGVASESERVALAQKIWDSEGVKLLQVVNQGTEAIRAQREEAARLGLTISQDTANAMAGFNDEVTRMQAVGEGLSRQILAELVPAMTSGMQATSAWIDEMGGAEAILETLTDGATVLAALLAGRYAGAMATATAAKVAATQQSIAYQAALARMAGVSRTAAASQTALAGATRAASGAMALLGGPAGVAVVAAGSLYYFREELGFVDVAAQNATAALDANSGAIRDGTAAALDATYDNLVNSLEAVSLQAQEAMAQLTELEARQKFYDDSHKGVADSVAGAVDQQTAKLEELWARQVELQNAIEENRASREEATDADRDGAQALEDIVVTAEAASEATSKKADATRDASEATNAHAAALEDLQNRLTPNRRETVQLAQDMNTLAMAMATGRGNTAQYAAMMGELQQEFILAQQEGENTADSAEDAGSRIASSFTTWGTVADNTLRSIDDSGRDAWLGLIDGSTSALDTVENAFEQTLANIAHMLTTQKLTFEVAGMMGLDTSGMQGQQTAGGMNANSLGDAGDLVSYGKKGYDYFFGGGASTASSYTGGFASSATGGYGPGWASNASGAAANSSGWMAGVGSNAMSGLYTAGAGIAGGYAGSAFGGAISDKQANSNYGATIGTTAGAIVGSIVPVIGTYLGSAIGGFLGGTADVLFGSGRKSYGQIGSEAEGFDGITYGDSEKYEGMTQRSALGEIAVTRKQKTDDDALAEMVGAFVEIDNALAGVMTGAQLEDTRAALDGWRSSKTANIGGIVDERLSAVVDATDSMFEKALEPLSGEELVAGLVSGIQVENVGEQMAGAVASDMNSAFRDVLRSGDDIEQSTQSILTAAQAVQVLGAGADNLNIQFNDAARGALDAAGNIAEMVGGVDALSQAQQSYYQAFYTEGERTARMQRDLAVELANMNMQMPETRSGYRRLVEAQNLNTEAGQRNYAQLMELAPAFADVVTEMGEMANGVRDFAAELSAARDSMSTAEDSVRRAYDAFDDQSFGMQVSLLESMGDSQAALALQRERELQGIDPLLHETQRFIWAMEDEARAKQDATQAAQNYVSELSRLQDSLGSISEWIDQRNATEQTPGLNLEAAGEQFARQLTLAESGDRDALQNITQYADRYLAAGEDMFASGSGFQRIQEDVLSALEGLPDQISSEEYLAAEIRESLFDALEGKATDSEINALMARVMDGDMSIESALASIYGTSEGTEGNTENLEDRARDQLESLNGLVGEMTRTTDQFVGLNSTMLSLQDSINALGVAQEEVARIERERAAAEIVALADIEKSRISGVNQDVSGYRSERNSLQNQLDSYRNQLDDRYSGGSARDRELADMLGDWSASKRESLLSHAEDGMTIIRGFGEVTPEQLNPIYDWMDEQQRIPGLISQTQRQIEQIQSRINSAQNAANAPQSELADLRAEYRDLMGEPAPFAKGGVFTNSIVSRPTHFDMGLMGEAGPEAIVPLHMGSDGLGIKDYAARRLPMPDMPLPEFPALGTNDVIETLRDLKREVAKLRRDNARLQGESNKHLSAANNQRGAAAKGQIGAIERGNKMLKRMEDDKRLEAAKR